MDNETKRAKLDDDIAQLQLDLEAQRGQFQLESSISLSQDTLSKLEDDIARLQVDLEAQRTQYRLENTIVQSQDTLLELERTVGLRVAEKLQLEKDIAELCAEFDRVKFLFEKKGYAQKSRQKCETTLEMISGYNSSTRYKRLTETKNALSYIHGGEDGAVFGAWDFLTKHAGTDRLEEFVHKAKRGKFLQGIFAKHKSLTSNRDSEMKKSYCF